MSDLSNPYANVKTVARPLDHARSDLDYAVDVEAARRGDLFALLLRDPKVSEMDAAIADFKKAVQLTDAARAAVKAAEEKLVAQEPTS